MSTSIHKVTVTGATGNLGPAVVKSLLDADFDVTVLTRHGSTSKVPSPAKAIPVDYQSVSSLTEALKGQDAVVSLVPVFAVPEKPLIDASIAAGVKRYLPSSEFGSNTDNANVAGLPFWESQLPGTRYVQEKAKETSLTYTRVFCGAFLDFGLSHGVFLDARGRNFERVDGGDRPTSATSYVDVAKAVVGILKHPKETENRPVFVQGTIVTQNRLVKIIDKVSPGQSWNIQDVKSEDLEKIGRDEMKKDQPDMMKGLFNILKRGLWGEGFGGQLPQDKLDNELLGVQPMSEQELEEVVGKFVS
ncbi:MAG: hypothetical protein Q9227_003149 [Pyrenula ochraceoflavens]